MIGAAASSAIAHALERPARSGALSFLGATLALVAGAAPAQHLSELQGRSRGGAVELHQAVLDARNDALALLVASHPDDRYVLPAALLRHRHGMRVAVLLATRGGGGQNSRGPETGDALERIRTLETEAGCSLLGADVWYLNRPDGGYRRTAEETYGEWGKAGTEADLVRLLRTIRPDLVLTTHHAEENHGHDLALVELLRNAVARAADPAVTSGDLPPHRVPRFAMGATSSPPPDALRLPFEVVDPVRGVTFRRLAYDVIARTHPSAGPLGPMEQLYEAELRLVPGLPGTSLGADLAAGLPSLCDEGRWPGSGSPAAFRTRVERDLPAALQDPETLVTVALAALRDLDALPTSGDADTQRRLHRRIEALERVVRIGCGVQVEVDAEPGAVAVPGEPLHLALRIHNADVRELTDVRIEALSGGTIDINVAPGEPVTGVPRTSTMHASLALTVPRDALRADGPGPFARDRYTPPIRLRVLFAIDGRAIPVPIDVPVDLRPPLEVEVVPPMLLLPNHRESLQFTVVVQRNSQFPIDDTVEVLGPAGYVVEGNRRRVELRLTRGDSLAFALRAPAGRKSGVDVLRIRVADQRIALPVHRVDVTIDPQLRVGLVRGRDDTLVSVLGIGGLGLRWSELSDADLAVRDLADFDTIVIDIRALRDRPRAHRQFRRLLDFASRPGRRLVVFYHKDTEYHPPGEGFVGAPFQPFQIGRGRVTRPDAPVRLLLPDHVLLTRPNRLLASDWDAWEQERGLYFPSVYADQYQAPIEIADPGQPPERSALLYARTGDGEFVYCALSLYRQLKKLHDGSVRLLANLLTPTPK